MQKLDQQIRNFIINERNILEIENPLLVILGPTGSGKTSVSISLAHELNAEIISADSAQIYKGMDVGTAKITKEEEEGIPHHMIDIITPDERFSVAAFKEKAEEIIADIYSRGKIPMVVGGTMLWIDALVYNFQFPDEANYTEFNNKEITQSLSEMQKQLKELDPKTYNSIDISNPRRVARALAYVENESKSFVEQQKKSKPKYNYILIGLRWEREKLYERLNSRVGIQLDQGLLDEVRTIRDEYGDDSPGMQCISYRQMVPFIEGESTLEEAISKLQQSNRNYAKRQITWWKRNEDIKWFDCK